MAIPNFYNQISYPEIRPVTTSETMWGLVSPYEKYKDIELDREVKRQKMGLDLNEDARNQAILEINQSQEGRAQKQEGRVEREFEEKESEWERKAGLREAVIGAAKAANGDPLQTIINLQNVHLMAGDASLGLEIQALAPKLIDAIPGYDGKSKAWGVLGVQVTPEQLAEQDAKIFASADGAAIITPGREPKFFQSPQGAQKADMDRQELALRQQALNQAAQRQKGDDLTTGERLTLAGIEDQISKIQKMDAAEQQNLSLGFQLRDGIPVEEANARATQIVMNGARYKMNQQRIQNLLGRRNMMLKKRYPDFEPTEDIAPEPSTQPARGRGSRSLVDSWLYPQDSGASPQAAEPVRPAVRTAPAPVYDPTSVPGMGFQGLPGPTPLSIQPGMSGSPYADPYAQSPLSTPLDQATLEDLAARGIIQLR